MKNYFKQIIELISDKKKLIILLVLMVINSSIDLIGIGLIGPYITIVLDPNLFNRYSNFLNFYFDLSRDYLIMWTGITISLIFLIKSIVSIKINKDLIIFCQNSQLFLRKRLITSFLTMPFSELQERDGAHYIQSIQNLTDQFSALIQSTLKTLGDLIIALFVLFLLAYTNIFALLFLLTIVVFSSVIYDLLNRKNLRNYGIGANNGLSKMITSVYESIRGFREIRTLGIEDFFKSRVDISCREYAENFSNAQIISTSPKYYLEFLVVVFIVGLILYSTFFIDDSYSLISTLAVFTAASLRLLPISNSLIITINKIRYSRSSIDVLYNDIKGNDYIYRGINKKSKMPQDFLSLEFINVYIKHRGAKECVLKNINLTLNKGEFIGLVGPSGSGKTTLIDSIIGFIKPESGCINFNGQNISSCLEDWIGQIAYLPQKPFLIDDSIKMNIILSDSIEKFDENLFNLSLQMAGLNDLISSLPLGVNTRVGDDGTRLSGGQRQRVALARAFYYKRNFLIMDESTSALDDLSEQDILNQLIALKGVISVIMVTHNNDNLTEFDRIYRLDNNGMIIS
ncbi:ABC transporter ATP-binding protein [Polynucleobacter sp. AP-Elch-400A-B2]|uniref:ATP-binding cassette domain-containing protein n=1 Tax=Polynucleobacter sp. AP-Elch-400A-B2 TaxID=2576930 RepID=UPI001BFE13BF|nr:ABC transporter ATP-binding protein [Polynucleobacter sp. AP-Elch-400A-B2]QWE24985.1 ABC transporter ATP-binding protein [Polynucleobacter sp. AP-Elch-400A-B2]